MSLVRNLMQSSTQGMIDTSDIENSFGEIHEGFLDDACVELTAGICSVTEAYYAADVIGSCRVVTEGADATIVMENIIKSGIAKLVDLWRRFLAKVRAFFAKAIQLVKSMMVTGKKFVDEFGPKIKSRVNATPNFAMKYNGYAYDVKAGRALAGKYLEVLGDKMDKLLVDGMDNAAKMTTDQIMAKIGIKSESERISASEYMDKVVRECDGQASSIADLRDSVKEAYRGGESSPDEQILKAGEIDGMLEHVANAKKDVDTLNRMKKAMETMCTNVIRKLQNLQKDTKQETDDKFETASTVSSWLSALMTASRTIISAQVTMTKEAAAGYTRVLRKVLNTSSKKLTESAYAFEGEDALDVELDDMDDVDEAAIAGADDPEGDTDDIGLVKEGCGKKCATEEGCKSDDEDPLAEAMMYL